MADERMVWGAWDEAWTEEALGGAPRPEFEARLRRDLERQVMAAAAEVRKGTQMAQVAAKLGTVAGAREGFGTVTPYMTVQPIQEFVKFAKEAFGAVETYQGRGSAGGFHFELRIGTSMIMAGGGGVYPGPWKPAALHIEVADCDASYAKALAAGAVSLYPPEDKAYGERSGGVTDPAGNRWFIGTPFADAPRLEGIRTVTPFILREGALDVIDFLKRGFNAREIGTHKSAEGAPVHGSLWIGDSMVELSSFDFGPSAFYVYVPDADAAYRQALEAGATGVHPPADQPYGDRMGTVQDQWGTTWYLSTHLGA